MASRKYHGADMTVSLQTKDATTVPVGELRGVNIIEQFENDDLYTADSIFRAGTKMRNYSVLAEATVAAFDIVLLREHHGGSGSAAATQMQDTSDPTLFQLTGTVTQHGQSTDLEAKVTDARLDGEIPVFGDLSDDAWLENNVSFVGRKVETKEV